MANARANTYCLALIIHSPQTPTPLRSSRRGARQCRGEAGPRAELRRPTFSLPQRPRYSCTQPWPRSEPPAPPQRRYSLRPLTRRRPGAPRRTRGASPEASERRGVSCLYLHVSTSGLPARLRRGVEPIIPGAVENLLDFGHGPPLLEVTSFGLGLRFSPEWWAPEHPGRRKL